MDVGEIWETAINYMSCLDIHNTLLAIQPFLHKLLALSA